MLRWEWYDDHNVCRLFIHCLLKANHAPKKWRGKVINRGQFITSQANLSKEIGLSVKQIRASLNKLKTTGEVAVKTTNKHSMISITNYSLFQDKGRQEVSQRAIKGQSKGNKQQ
jgi:DNA-binding transcriptional regulator PaaX